MKFGINISKNYFNVGVISSLFIYFFKNIIIMQREIEKIYFFLFLNFEKKVELLALYLNRNINKTKK